MKKPIALILVLIMALGITACGANSDKGNSNDTTAPSSTVAESTVPDTVADYTADIDSLFDDDNYDVKINNEFQEEVVFDDSDVKVTVTEITKDDILGPCVTFLVENQTDRNIYVTTDNLSVNDCAITASLFSEVAAGKSAYQDMYIYKSSLKESGISEVGKIEFIVEVSDADSFDLIAKSDIITLVVDSNVNQEVYSDGDVIFSADGITIYCEDPSFENDELSYYIAKLLVVNETDNNIRVCGDDASADGFMMYPYFYASVPAGKCAFAHLSFMQQEIEDNKLSDVSEVEFTLIGLDSETFLSIFESDVIKVEVK